MLDRAEGSQAFGLVHASLEAVIYSCNDVYAGFLGITKEAAVGRRVSDFASGIGTGGPNAMVTFWSGRDSLWRFDARSSDLMAHRSRFICVSFAMPTAGQTAFWQ